MRIRNHPLIKILHQLEQDPWFAHSSTPNSDVLGSDWAPEVDIIEDDKQFLIYCDVPGVDSSNIDIDIDQNILTIKGEREIDFFQLQADADVKSTQVGDKSKKYLSSERQKGRFCRRFSLPQSVDGAEIKATCSQGILTICIPKQQQRVSRKIAVETV